MSSGPRIFHKLETLHQSSSVRRLQSGQSLLEVSVVSVVLMLLVFSIIDLGRAFFTVVALDSVVSEGAHWAAAYPQCIPTATDSQAGPPECRGTNSIVGRMLNENVDLVRARFVGVTLTGANPASWVAGVPPPGETVTLKVTYEMNLLTPVIQALFGNKFVLGAASEEVVRGIGTVGYAGQLMPDQGGVPPVTAPPAPTNVAQNPAICNNGYATLTWNAVSGASGYRIYDSTGTTLLQTITPASTTTASVPDGMPGSATYIVRAFTSDGVNEAESPSVSVSTSCSNVQPGGFSVTCVSGGIRVDWSVPTPTDSAIAGYALWRGSPASKVATFGGATTITGNYIFSTAADNPATWYIQAVKSDGSSIGLASSSINKNCVAAATPPAAVQNYRWTGTQMCNNGVVSLAWNVSTDATGYTIYDGVGGTLFDTSNNTTTSTTITVGIGSSNTYTIKAWTLDISTGNRLYGPGTSLGINCPSFVAPTITKAVCSGADATHYASVDLTWTPFSGDSFITGYQLIRQDGTIRVNTMPLSPGTKTYTFQTGDNPSGFYLRLLDTNNNPIGTPSAAISVSCSGPTQIQNFAFGGACQGVPTGSNRIYTVQWTTYTWPAVTDYYVQSASKPGPYQVTNITVNGTTTTGKVMMPKQIEGTANDLTITAYDNYPTQVSNSTSAYMTPALPVFTNTTCP